MIVLVTQILCKFQNGPHKYRLPRSQNGFTIACIVACIFMSPLISDPPPSIHQISSANYMFSIAPRHPDIIFSVHHSFFSTSTCRVPSDPRRAFFANNEVFDTIHRLYMSHFALKSCLYTFCSILCDSKIGESHRVLKASYLCSHELSY